MRGRRNGKAGVSCSRFCLKQAAQAWLFEWSSCHMLAFPFWTSSQPAGQSSAYPRPGAYLRSASDTTSETCVALRRVTYLQVAIWSSWNIAICQTRSGMEAEGRARLALRGRVGELVNSSKVRDEGINLVFRCCISRGTTCCIQRSVCRLVAFCLEVISSNSSRLLACSSRPSLVLPSVTCLGMQHAHTTLGQAGR